MIKHLLNYFNKNKACVWFDIKNPPIEGDSITVGDMRAVFEKK